MSLFKTLQNEIRACEEKNDRIIPHDSYFLVHIYLSDQNHQLSFIKSQLKIHNPLLIYHARSSLYLLFSSLDHGVHFLEGNHYKICSHYTASSSLFYKTPTVCRIVELDSRIKILVYFQLKIDEFYRHSLAERENLPWEKVESLTSRELTKMITKRGIDLSQIDPEEKYGTLYKLEGKKIITMSEQMDLLKMEKYTSFFFES